MSSNISHTWTPPTKPADICQASRQAEIAAALKAREERLVSWPKDWQRAMALRSWLPKSVCSWANCWVYDRCRYVSK